MWSIQNQNRLIHFTPSVEFVDRARASAQPTPLRDVDTVSVGAIAGKARVLLLVAVAQTASRHAGDVDGAGLRVSLRSLNAAMLCCSPSTMEAWRASMTVSEEAWAARDGLGGASDTTAASAALWRALGLGLENMPPADVDMDAHDHAEATAMGVIANEIGTIEKIVKTVYDCNGGDGKGSGGGGGKGGKGGRGGSATEGRGRNRAKKSGH